MLPMNESWKPGRACKCRRMLLEHLVSSSGCLQIVTLEPKPMVWKALGFEDFCLTSNKEDVTVRG